MAPSRARTNSVVKIEFSGLQFYKAVVRKNDKGCRKRPAVSGSRNYCATPMFAFEPSEIKKKELHDHFVSSGKGIVLAELLSGNNFKPSLIYDTSISGFKNKKATENLQNKNTRITIARMFDKFLNNDCCYHIEDNGSRQFIENF